METIKKNWKIALAIGIILYTLLVAFISIEAYKAYGRYVINKAMDQATADLQKSLDELGNSFNSISNNKTNNKIPDKTIKPQSTEKPSVTIDLNKQRICDYANLLTSKEEDSIAESIKSFINQYKIDMVIVTIDKNDKGSSQEYADDFVDNNDFGYGDNKDSILFLIDMDYREIYISTGGNAIWIYTDNKIDSMLDDCFNEISVGKYYECCKEFIDGAIKNYD